MPRVPGHAQIALNTKPSCKAKIPVTSCSLDRILGRAVCFRHERQMCDSHSSQDPLSPEAAGLSRPLRVYFARAIDGQEARAISSLTSLVNDDLMAVGMELVDPTVSEPQPGEDIDSHSIDHYRAIVDHDLAVLRTCDAVLMDMSIVGRSYIGCICEMTYAFLWNVPCAVYIGMQDTKRPWLHYHAAVFQQRKDAIAYLVKRLRHLHARYARRDKSNYRCNYS